MAPGAIRPASGFPQSVTLEHIALPRLTQDLHIGILIAMLVVLIGWLVLTKTRYGFAVSATGEAPKAATFAGFNDRKVTMTVLLISGAMAGLAGMIEVAGNTGRSTTSSPLAMASPPSSSPFSGGSRRSAFLSPASPSH